jgi:asparagine synthase (glutamine-hydrolysing)
MCGIYGKIESSKAVSRDIFPVSHRGPDFFDTTDFIVGDNRVTLAHWRLAIIDLKSESNQPFESADTGSWIVFNGEIYNYRELRALISSNFKTNSDTEVLLAAYDKWGVECLKYLRGMFSFIIFDQKKKQLFVARDRFGIKPLYFKSSETSLEFASEIKQLLVMNPQINLSRTRDYLFFGSQDHTAETLFEGIQQIKGGQYMLVDLKTPTTPSLRTWYKLQESPSYDGSYEDAQEEFRERFFQSISLHLQADVPLGFSLSGGLDSTSILCSSALLSDFSDNQPLSFNATFDAVGLNESPLAILAAEKAKSHLSFVTPNPQLVEKITNLTFYHDEPIPNASILAQDAVYRAASVAGIKVMLVGQGGDEILGGYDEFVYPYISRLLRQGSLPAAWKESLSFQRKSGFSLLNAFKRFFITNVPIRAYSSLYHSFLSSKSAWADSGLLFQDATFPHPWRDYAEEFPLGTFRNQSEFMIGTSSLPKLLHWEDRSSMAHSIESRVPFLDHELVEFCLSLPPSFKCQGGVTKRILRSALCDLLPARVVGRLPKTPFAAPEEHWLRCNGQALRDECIAGARLLPHILSLRGVELLINNFLSGGSYDPVIWRIFTFSIWARVFGCR